jgi:hypothetical protein
MGATHWFFLPLLFAAQLLPAKPAPQHVTVVPTLTTSGSRTVLHLDVTPKPNIHVYGPGAKDFTQPSLKITAPDGIVLDKAAFPPPEMVLDPILKERIPMYTKTFRVVQPTNLRAGQAATVSAVLTYQACDDKMCFAPASLPVTWLIKN